MIDNSKNVMAKQIACEKYEQKGIKFDEEKLRWDLLPLDLVNETVKVLTLGAKKYGPNNWQKVTDGIDRYYAALMRHITAYRSGEFLDDESGLTHLAHAMCNLIFLYALEMKDDA
jgi:hypothetical protein